MIKTIINIFKFIFPTLYKLVFLNNFIKDKKIFSERNFYKPFNYEKLYTKWETHEKTHWLPAELSLLEDVEDWKKMPRNLKTIVNSIFKFFTQADVDVSGGYVSLMPLFPQPECRMMMLGFASREAIHISAYSYLSETLGMEENQYKEFLEVESMFEKQKYIKQFEPSILQNYIYSKLNNEFVMKMSLFVYFIVFSVIYYQINTFEMFEFNYYLFNFINSLLSMLIVEYFLKLLHTLKENHLEHIVCTIAMFSGFTEGVQLFSTFAILSEFTLNGYLKGMGQIIAWSLSDESKHVDGMIHLFNIVRAEQNIDLKKLSKKIYKIAEEMVSLEDHFIEHIFSETKTLFNLNETNLKQYIRYLTDERLSAMGFDRLFKCENPLKYMDNLLNPISHTNFFENTPTEYAKATIQDNWDSVF